jgi:signal peptidase II
MMWTVAITLVLDQLSKYLVIRHWAVGESRPIVQHVFHLTYVRNTGGAFGVLQGWGPVLLVISCVAMVVVLVLAWQQHARSQRKRVQEFALALLLGGALGNLIDRVQWGYVIDFLDFRVWPVFNVADTAITCGVALMLLDMCTTRKTTS